MGTGAHKWAALLIAHRQRRSMKYYIYLEVNLPNEWKVGINKIAVALKTGSWPKFLTDFDDLTTKRTGIPSSVRWCYQNYNYL